MFLRKKRYESHVATALTVYGIETKIRLTGWCGTTLQQPLPFTVLKLTNGKNAKYKGFNVATALTVYGIETFVMMQLTLLWLHVATALTVYGIETR